jgi:peptide/nickel transport system substrate-binding protein
MGSKPSIPAPVHSQPLKKLEITFAQMATQNPAVTAITMAWKSGGFDTTGLAMPSGALLEKNAKSELPILFTGWQPDFPGILNTIPFLFHSKSPENHSGYANRSVDGLIEAALRGEAPEANIKKALAIVEEDCPGIPLYIQRDLTLMRSADIPRPN